MKYTFPLYLIALALITIALQNAGVIPPHRILKIAVDENEPVRIQKYSPQKLDLGLDLDLDLDL